jgi:hypothetical protein
MEQQQRALQQTHDSKQQQGSTTKLANAQAGLHLARLAATAGLLLRLWLLRVLGDTSQDSRLKDAITTVAYSVDVATGIAAIWRSEGTLRQWYAETGDAAAAMATSFATAVTAAGFADSAAAPAGRRARQSARLLAEHSMDEKVAREAVSPLYSSLLAAQTMVLHLGMHADRAVIEEQ